MRLITINNSSDITPNINQQRQNTMNQNIFPFRTCHVEGYKTKFIHTRIVCHINGTGARETALAYLHPYRLFTYITGFSNTHCDL